MAYVQTPDDTIQLKIETPRFDLSEMDAAIKRLNEFALITKPRTIKVSFEMGDAIQRIQKELASIKSIAGKAGDVGIGERNL